MQRQSGASRGTRGWVVGRVAGAPVVVSPGWLVAAAVLTYLFAPTVRSYAPGLGQRAYAVAAAFVLLLLVSVFLHELAHALVARRRGVVVRELAVTLLGGHTQFGAAAPTPATSAVVAIAGPLVNLGLGGLAWWALQGVPQGGVPALMLAGLALTNGLVGLFNLVPALPLDGGRVLEAVVWQVTGRRYRGTAAGAWAGRVLALAVVAWALGRPLLAGRAPDLFTVAWAALIGAFLWSGAGQALGTARAQRSVEGFALGALVRPALVVPADGTVADLDRETGLDRAPGAGQDVVLVEADGTAGGIVDPAALDLVPAGARASTPLRSVAVVLPPGSEVDGSLTGSPAVQEVARAARLAPVMVVHGPDGAPTGVLHAQDVISALQARRSGGGT